MNNQGICLVILSGGQDSTTVLAWAKTQFQEVHALTFDYGQKHAIEIESAKKVAEIFGVASHEIVPLPSVLKGTSPLVNKDREVAHYDDANAMPKGVEPTFVPGRNLLFLTIAANRAAALGTPNVAIGVSQEDFGGYFDCRQDFLDDSAKAISRALTGEHDRFLIHAPLINMTKKQTVEFASRIPGAFEALAYTHTSYDGDYPPNPLNHASILRARGFYDAGKKDPLIVRAIAEKKLPDDYPADGFVQGTKYSKGLPDMSKQAPPRAKIEDAAKDAGINTHPPKDVQTKPIAKS